MSVASANAESKGLAAGLVLDADEKAARAARDVEPLTASPDRGWRAIGWFGLLIAAIAFVDLVLNLYPAAWSSPEWEFGTIARTLGSLPLFSIGMAAILGSYLARGRRIGILVTSILLVAFALLILGAWTVFTLDVPMALNAAGSGPASLVIKKTIVRTTSMGLGFGAGYLIAAVASFRHIKRRKRV